MEKDREPEIMFSETNINSMLEMGREEVEISYRIPSAKTEMGRHVVKKRM